MGFVNEAGSEFEYANLCCREAGWENVEGARGGDSAGFRQGGRSGCCLDFEIWCMLGGFVEGLLEGGEEWGFLERVGYEIERKGLLGLLVAGVQFTPINKLRRYGAVR